MIRAGGKVVATRHLRGRRFDVRVPLPRRDVTVSVIATTLAGRRSRASVPHVFGLPRAARPRGTVPHLDGRLAQRIVPLVRSFPGSSAVYVRDLTTGAGTAWNARARFPAGSTLKLAIAVEALRTLGGKPARGSYADGLLRRAIIASDNVAANQLEVLFGGSTSGGSYRVNRLMRGLGLVDSEMYGGYIPGTLARRRPIPMRVDERPYYGLGKSTSALRPRAALRLHPPRRRRQGPAGEAAPGVHGRATHAISCICSPTSPTAASSTASSPGGRPPCTRRAGSSARVTTQGSSTGPGAPSRWR